MLKRHAIQVLRQAGHTLEEIAELVAVGRRSVQRVAAEAVITAQDFDRHRAAHRLGRPSKAEPYRARATAWLAEDPGLLTVELLRRAKLAGYEGGKVTVRFLDGTTQRIHFFASRLKYSRWVEVSLVPNQQVETLTRTLVEHFAALGGIPLLAVFDRPKTMGCAPASSALNTSPTISPRRSPRCPAPPWSCSHEPPRDAARSGCHAATAPRRGPRARHRRPRPGTRPPAHPRWPVPTHQAPGP